MRLLLILVALLCLGSLRANDKAAIAQDIFDRLVAAWGDQRLPEPELIFARTRSFGAKADGRLITLEEAAYDVCAALGPDAEAALAGILAHELIHYYEGHTWEDGFVGLVGAAEVSRSVREDVAALKKDEIEADYQGGFLAHLAGFPSTNVMPRVLTGIYQAYELPEELAKYPSLSERQAIATTTFERLTELIDVFEMGNILAALGRYDEAADYYSFLLNEFQSREIYNNLGVIYVQAAIPLFQKGDLKYIYPVELDLDSRLAAGTRNVGVAQEQRDRFLELAAKNFERAIELDENYPVALVNLACAKGLLAKSQQDEDLYLEAEVSARKAIKLADRLQAEQTSANGHLIRAIIAEDTGESETATAQFAAAAASPLAALNAEIRQTGILPQPSRADGEDEFSMEELIAEVAMSEIEVDLLDWSTNVPITQDRRTRLRALHAEDGQTAKLLHSTGNGRRTMLLYKAEDSYPGETALELKIGASQAEIIEQYDQPDRVVPSAGGIILIYARSQLVFLLRKDRLVGWYLYRDQE